MSWLRLRHTTVYQYSGLVTIGPHRLVVRPREGHDLRVEDFALRCEPEGEVEWCRDIFGNSVARIPGFARPSDRLSIVAESILWRSLADPSPPLPAFWDEAVSYDPLEAAVAGAYRTSVYPDDRETVRSWLEEPPAAFKEGERGALGALSDRIRKEIRYTRREEKGVQSPAETLARRKGSCRDMAALFLEAGRELGYPMRFASGYLEGEASREGDATTHAWVEAYLPELGWRGFDPMLGSSTTASHIVSGVSNHPRGVMPVSGLYFGNGIKTTSLKATVFTERIRRPGLGPV